MLARVIALMTSCEMAVYVGDGAPIVAQVGVAQCAIANEIAINWFGLAQMHQLTTVEINIKGQNGRIPSENNRDNRQTRRQGSFHRMKVDCHRVDVST